MGNSNSFVEFLANTQYYVDKTLLVDDILLTEDRVTVITRPPGFGKSVNLSMLESFFDITADTKQAFSNFDISYADTFELINTMPVIKVDFKPCKDSATKEELLDKFRISLLVAYKKYIDYISANVVDMHKPSCIEMIKLYTRLESALATPDELSNSLTVLMKCVRDLFDKEIILLIDNYDIPLLECYSGRYMHELNAFFMLFFSFVLKDNLYLYRAIFTGVQCVGKSSVFLNIEGIGFYTVLISSYREYFGYSLRELNNLSRYYGFDIETVKGAYCDLEVQDRYLYNPKDVAKYITSGIEKYELNEDIISLFVAALNDAKYNFISEFYKFIEGNEITTYINVEPLYTKDMDSASLWGLLINYGYVSAVKLEHDYYSLYISNIAARYKLVLIFAEYIKLNGKETFNAIKFIEIGDMTKFVKWSVYAVRKCMDYYYVHENAIKTIHLLLCLMLNHLFTITYDSYEDCFLLVPKDEYRFSVLIGLKSGSGLQATKKRVLNSLKKKRGRNLVGEIFCIGIAYNKLKCDAEVEKIII
ncbi:MAG: AAA family ATPase [Endomicrobium sp.]|jgi:hypothetical protein|nr:AAA family ATPase [Endomicrobium sp.]